MIFLFFQFFDITITHENLAKKDILKSPWGNASETFSFLIGVIAVAKVFGVVTCLIVEGF